MATARDIKVRWDKMVDRRSQWDIINQDLAELIMPHRGNITTIRTPGAKQTSNLFDSTAIFANVILAASMHGSVTNNSIKWFRLKMRDEQLNGDVGVRDWLQDVGTPMLLAFRQSNFNSQLSELYLDLGAFGMGNLLLEERPEDEAIGEGFRGFQFSARPPGTYTVSENSLGAVDTVYYKTTMALRAAADRWGGVSLSKESQESLLKDQEKPISLLHAVFPRPMSERRGQRTHPWASWWMEIENKPHKIAEGGFHEFPFMVPRWQKTSGEMYGRGPGHVALPDIKTLNKAKQLELRAWAKAIDPPMKILHDGIIGAIDITPSGFTVVESMNAMEALKSEIQLDVTQSKSAEIRESIRQIFYTDLLLQLMARVGPAMTATEVIAKQQILQEILGPTFGRLVFELLNPLIDRSFGLMSRAGALPEAPQILVDLQRDQGVNIDVEYEGPLARGQRNQEVQNLTSTILEARAMVGEQDQPGIVDDVFDLEEAIRKMAEVRGIPSSIVRTKDQVAQLQDARSKARERVQQQDELKKGAEALASASQAEPLLKMVQEGNKIAA